MRGTTWGMDEDKHENHWRRTFCQIPFPAIYEHAENGKRSLHRLVEFFRRKAEAERTANEELRSMIHAPLDSGLSVNLDDLEDHGSSVRKALNEVKNYVDATCHQQLLLARVLEEQVAEPLVSLQEASEMYIRTLQGEIRKVNDAYNEALAAHSHAAVRLRKASEDLADSKERQRTALHGIGVPAFELQRLAARVAKCGDEVAHAELSKAQAKTLLYNRIVSRDEMAMAVSVAYQKAEEERLDQLNSCLQRFLHIEKERAKASEKMISSLETHIVNASRAEDIQLLIHNHRNPDNMHFQGKALALLDWHWNKMVHEREKQKHSSSSSSSHVEAGSSSSSAAAVVVRSTRRDRAALFTDPIEIVSCTDSDDITRMPPSSPSINTTTITVQKSPHGALADSSMGRAIHCLFAPDSQPNTPSKKPQAAPAASASGDGGEDITAPGAEPTEAEASSLVSMLDEEIQQTTDEMAQPLDGGSEPTETTLLPPSPPSPPPPPPTPTSPSFVPELTRIVETTCETHKGRAFFVKCLNRQRSLETRVKDRTSFDILVRCFNRFLDQCKKDDDVKPAKTAMILAETFYLARKDYDLSAYEDQGDQAQVEAESRRARGGSWGFAHHGGGAGPSARGATRMYLQEKVKTHEIWKNPGFWEKALLLAIGEELQRTPQHCAWEDLPSGISSRNRHATGSSSSSDHHHHHEGATYGGDGDAVSGGFPLSTREEAVSRVHNIVFGQLGSFTLSMLEFDVPFMQIESFVETMCDAHELTEDQRFLLRKNLQEIFATLK